MLARTSASHACGSVSLSLALIYWDGSGLVMAYKRLEDHTFTWPGIRDGLMTLGHAQFEALFAGLDWRRVRSVETRAPEAVE